MIAAAALAVAGGLLGAGTAAADPATPTPVPAPATTPATAPPPAPMTAIDHDGTYAVGTDIVPGIYATAGPVEGDKCYWKRVGADNTTADNALSSKPQVVVIDPTDIAFKTRGCQPWQLTDSAPPPAGSPPWLAQLQLRHYLDTLNGLAGQSGNEQLPPS